jgi:hypothetical protein
MSVVDAEVAERILFEMIRDGAIPRPLYVESAEKDVSVAEIGADSRR